MINLSILVVDDEEIIRNGICRKINKLLPDVELVYKAETANNAIEIIKKYHPQIVITDIRMPEVDGLQFIAMAKNIVPEIKFIIISGFQDFKYAREAIKLGVEDYLLKPIENNQLKDIILKLKDKLQEELRQLNLVTELETKFNNNLCFLKNKYLTDLIYADKVSDINEILDNLNSINIKFNYNSYVVLTLELINIKTNSSIISSSASLEKYGVINMAEEILSSLGNIIAFENLKYENQIVVIICSSYDLCSDDNSKIIRFCKKLISSTNTILKLYSTIGISSSFDDLELISSNYMKSYLALIQKIVLGNNRVINISNVAFPNKITFLMPEEVKLLLIDYIEEGNSKKAKQTLYKFFNYIKSLNLSYINIKAIYIELIILFTKTVKESGGTFETIFIEDISSEKFLLQCNCLDSLLDWINECVETTCTYIVNLKKSSGKKVIDKIIHFINNNYYLNINLNDLGAKYFLNSNYLCQLFKNEIGENFTEYLTQIRIEKAKELLNNTDLKSYKVAELVGYNNPRYFSEVFQKIVGVTPTNYRQKKLTIMNLTENLVMGKVNYSQ